MNKVLRTFTREVEVAIKLAFVTMLASAFVLTFAWGYEGRQQARRWREVACTYRLSELQRATPGLGSGTASCETLNRVGLGLVAPER